MSKNRETVTLYGRPTDPAVIASKKKIEATGRTVEIKPAPGDGVGPCGKLCRCEMFCGDEAAALKAAGNNLSYL